MSSPHAETPAEHSDSSLRQLNGLSFVKGHGTGNDFVLISDPDGELELSPAHVSALCDRHLGIGADGLIRAVPSSALPEGRELLEKVPEATWFMDYRNGDGSIAEMCGNGVRVFVHFLAETGIIDLAAGESVVIGTRAGTREVHRTDTGYSISMGPWSFIDPEMALESASDSLVRAAGLYEPRPALSISMGNPHTVVALSSQDDLSQVNLYEKPQVEPVPPHGTNVEFVVPQEPLVADGVGRVRMRVHERGVGETMSCGTGACAAAAAVRVWAGAEGADSWLVDVPGGTVQVDFVRDHDGAEDVILSGPAELVFRGTLG